MGLVEDIEGVTLSEKRTSTEQANLATWVLIGAAGAFAVLTAVVVPFTDWNDAQSGVAP